MNIKLRYKGQVLEFSNHSHNAKFNYFYNTDDNEYVFRLELGGPLRLMKLLFERLKNIHSLIDTVEINGEVLFNINHNFSYSEMYMKNEREWTESDDEEIVLELGLIISTKSEEFIEQFIRDKSKLVVDDQLLLKSFSNLDIYPNDNIFTLEMINNFNNMRLPLNSDFRTVKFDNTLFNFNNEEDSFDQVNINNSLVNSDYISVMTILDKRVLNNEKTKIKFNVYIIDEEYWNSVKSYVETIVDINEVKRDFIGFTGTEWELNKEVYKAQFNKIIYSKSLFKAWMNNEIVPETDTYKIAITGGVYTSIPNTSMLSDDEGTIKAIIISTEEILDVDSNILFTKEVL